MAGSSAGNLTGNYLGIQYVNGVPQGQHAPNASPGTVGATSNAQAAVTGLQATSPGANSTTPTGAGPGGPGSSYNVDQQGNTSYTVTPNLAPQEAQYQQENTKLQGSIQGEQQNSQQAATSALAKQQADAESALLTQRGAMNDQSFQSRLSSLSSMGGSSPQVQYGGGVGNGSPEAAARDAAFARAKEKAGQNAVAGLKSVQGQVEGRGMMGSTYEAGLMGDVIGGASGQVNDFNREQLISDLNRGAQVSDTTYQGNITQRGQDLQRQQALMQLLNMGNLY